MKFSENYYFHNLLCTYVCMRLSIGIIIVYNFQLNMLICNTYSYYCEIKTYFPQLNLKQDWL